MSVIPATGCCCEPDPGCPFKGVCKDREDWWEKVRLEYITVGKPKGPTVYPGTYWPAWHNTLSVRSLLDVDLKLRVIKRTLVQTPCGALPSCLPGTLPITDNCLSTGIFSNPGCRQTLYTDNFNWTLNTQLSVRGVNPDQTRNVIYDTTPHLQDFPSIPDPSTPGYLPVGKPYCSIPGGYYPCGIQGPCNTGTCVNIHEATTFSSSPSWWPGENRKLIPRFSIDSATVVHTAIPSSAYPQLATCGSVVYDNRCTTATSTSSEPVCLDFPIIVIPGHSGAMCDGQPSIPCGVLNKELGANNVIWGFDINEPTLIAALNAMGLPDGTYVGLMSGAWIVKYTQPVTGVQKLRFFFDIGVQVPLAGDTFKFTTNATITEKRTATRRLATTSWFFDIDFSFIPRKWCLHDKQCDCTQSYCENNPSVINYAVTASISDQCSTNDINLSLDVGLEDVSMQWWLSNTQHQLCPCGTDCGSSGLCGIVGLGSYCWQWANLPEGGFGIPAGATPVSPGGTKSTRRFLGDEPIERGHPFWRRYRNRYNHTATTIDWWANGYSDPFSRCRLAVYGNIISLSQIYAPARPAFPWEICCSGATSLAGFAHSPVFCDPTCCFCTVPDQTGPSSCYTCLPGGCYDVRPSWWYDCPPTNPYPTGTCGPTTKSNDPYVGDPNAVVPCFSISLFPDCNPYHRCGHQVLALCGSLGFNSCELAGYAYSVALPDVLIIDWNPSNSCGPLGTYNNVYTASETTVCEGPSAWTRSTYSVVVS